MAGFDDLFMEDVVVVPESAPGAVLVSAFGFGALNGVLRSSDGGASFTTVLPQVVARELIVAAGDPRVVWARTEPDEAPAQRCRSALQKSAKRRHAAQATSAKCPPEGTRIAKQRTAATAR